MKLALKVVLATVLGTLVVLVVSGYLRTRREIAMFDSDIRNDHALIGATLALCVASTWTNAGPERALGLVAQADADRDYLTIGWIYPPDHPAARDYPAHFPLTLSSIEHRVVERAGFENSFLVTHVPVRERGQLLGAIELAESLAVRDAFVSTSLLGTAVATGSMVLVSGLVVLVFGVLIVGRPMRLLADTAKRIGRGDLSGRLTLRQRDEIGDLACEVNAMCERLNEATIKAEKEALARIATLDQLRHADRLITVGRLAAGVAHELGTPLNVIAGRTKMLRRADVGAEQRQEYLAIIAEQAERMATIIRQLLDFARRREPKLEVTDLLAVCRNIEKLMSPIVAKRDLTLVVLSSEPVLVRGDRAQLEQVMSNLVTNAMHACASGGRIELTCGECEVGGQRRAYVRVKDDGHGMDSATQQRIFEPFFTTKEVGQGTGLGLSVAHGIIAEHGGVIHVESEPARGSSFSILLPSMAA